MRWMQYLRSLVFTIFLFVFTPLCGVVVAMTAVLPYRMRYATTSGYAGAVLWVLKKTCRLTYTVEGLEKIPPGNYITMWKHSSTWETIAMMVLLPPSAWVLKRELMWVPLLGWGLAALKPIAIDRRGGSLAINQVVEQGRVRLDDGLWVVIFPEGTRMAPGETRRYGTSGALLAIEANKKIVPVAHNAADFWPRRGLLKKPGNIRVVFGAPVEPVGNDPRATNDKVQAWIEGKIAELRRG
jgi:1-acyl-sn-glycerol-3-phosphate acyltransferase